eukprot:m.337409 g.337409  ORF g.337409 m.337409 type:complete len:343 (+) comp18126_c0_seq1:164-1192(+)
MAQKILLAVAIGILLSSVVAEDNPPCKPFKDIYANGKELCEKMWDDAFKYETNETQAYDMWFFGKNPNEEMSKKLLPHVNSSDFDFCHLDYFHIDGPPSRENDAFTECHPWVDRACCTHDTVLSSEKLRKGYGAGYEWDRCGKMSPECERFFVHEACFYECEPAVGFYRKYPIGPHASVDGSGGSESHPVYNPVCDPYSGEYNPESPECESDHNSWQVYKMPIKASFCDAWFTACKNELFCALADGNFFGCARDYEAQAEANKTAELALNKTLEEQIKKNKELEAQLQNTSTTADNDDSLSAGVIVGIVAGCVVILLLIIFVLLLVIRERKGRALFSPMTEG